MGIKWDNLPNEVLAQITEAVKREEKAYGRFSKIQQWPMVNKQWYEWFQSLKYKDVSISLKNPNILLKNIAHSKWEPGKWVKSVTSTNVSARSDSNTSPDEGDALCLLMTRYPNVKHVMLPEYMQDEDWTYFSRQLVDTNVWKLHSLSTENLPQAVSSPSARTQYFTCVYHLRSSIRSFY